ncbi:MAG: hypothetical protein CXR31_11720 [Geobacter sp.]|nr:MAG: hypothetical protein CXR31_11720 [Geobacter sp.]
MDFIELESPERRENLLPFQGFHYPVTEIIYLPPPSKNEAVDFFKIVRSRSTRREFGQITLQQLSELFWYSAKTSLVIELDEGHKWYHRPSPSGGGRHPIDHIIFRYDGGNWDAFLYDSIAHVIGKLEVDSSGMGYWIEDLFRTLGINATTVVWNIAQFQRSTSVYKNASSLIYRDEGAIQATFGLVAEALNLNFCTIGVSGEPYISRLFMARGQLRGIGGFCIGPKIIE